MSATLGAMLRELEPSWSQVIFERLDAPAMESSSPWNNAGTGHSALCELNYTPESNGKVNPAKAIDINEKFQVSRQFWAHQVDTGVLGDPREFINPTTHMSFAQGKDQVEYLKRRFDVLAPNHMFHGMEYSADNDVFAEKLPVMAKGRDFNETPVAISWTDIGTDVNYGALTRQFLTGAKASGTEIFYGTEVKKIDADGAGWKITSKNLHTGDTQVTKAKFVFVGAGGYALDLLRGAGVNEVKGFAGFPIAGLWLRATNPELIEAHNAKVYGKAKVGAPPMSVPHLDTRIIDGKKGLLFGPYAGWSSKFLKNGSYLDMFKSIRPDNIPSYLGVGVAEMGLTKYLIEEVLKDFDARIESLREYVPAARPEDWETVIAGQRVQVIKPAKFPKGGTLEFGTALINNQEGSIAGLLGASPGASTSPSAMLELLERCFGDRMVQWAPKINEMFPTYGRKLNDDKALYQQNWDYTQKSLNLER